MKTELPIKLSRIDEDGYHLLVSMLINGKKANMLIDTGASRTVFDLNRIKRFVKEKEFNSNEKLSTGLGTSTMQSFLVTIEMDKITIKNYTTVLLDLSHVNNSYEQIKLKAIDGVIGSDLLVQYKAVINFEKKVLKLTGKKKK